MYVRTHGRRSARDSDTSQQSGHTDAIAKHTHTRVVHARGHDRTHESRFGRGNLALPPPSPKAKANRRLN